MQDIYIVPLEKLETRYTTGWYYHIPKMIEKVAADRNIDINIVILDGDDVPPTPTPGAFLDFGATNIFKSSQLMIIAELFRQGKIKAGSKFLYTDAWNPTVIQLKYMSELLNIPVEIHGMWHAGSWDSQDFLGRLIGNKPWVRHSELAMLDSYDTNWFATEFHIDMFIREMFSPFYEDSLEYYNPKFQQVKDQLLESKKIAKTGWPMDYLLDVLKPYQKLIKKQQICFPHRLAPEKQLEIFKDLAASMPEYEWVVCQERELTKHEYHTILGESQIVFSANLQETFGISCIEGLICGAWPMVPGRLSYQEMYDSIFRYPNEWTKNWQSYQKNKSKMIDLIRNTMDKFELNSKSVDEALSRQFSAMDNFIKATPLIDRLVG